MVDSDTPSPLGPALATQAAASQRTIVTVEPRTPIALRKLSQSELLVTVEKHLMFQSGRNGGQRANLGSCDLSYLDFRGVTLIGAELSGANFQNADLRGADLSQSILFAADLRRADLRGAKLDRVDLRGACFRAANLTDVSLADADLSPHFPDEPFI